MVSVPTVREVVSMVTARLPVMSNVRFTTEPTPPGTVGVLDQLVPVLQVLAVSVFQLPFT